VTDSSSVCLAICAVHFWLEIKAFKWPWAMLRSGTSRKLSVASIGRIYVENGYSQLKMRFEIVTGTWAVIQSDLLG
jgi:hypothetical protein